MLCNKLFLKMLTLSSASILVSKGKLIHEESHITLAKALSLDVWKETVFPLDADGVREHLLGWTIDSDRAGFDTVVNEPSMVVTRALHSNHTTWTAYLESGIR